MVKDLNKIHVNQLPWGVTWLNSDKKSIPTGCLQRWHGQIFKQNKNTPIPSEGKCSQFKLIFIRLKFGG